MKGELDGFIVTESCVGVYLWEGAERDEATRTVGMDM